MGAALCEQRSCGGQGDSLGDRMLQVPRGCLYLGGNRAGGDVEPLLLERHRLTTHGVIVGMTGSGKTGLGVVLLEELLLGDVPVLVLDPKGDMGNLMLQFPELRPDDFRPWIDEGAASREGKTPDQRATEVAARWKEGLESWNVRPARIRALANSSDITLYTPGSKAGVSLDVLGSPGADPSVDLELARDEIEAFVTSLLKLAGVDADPMSSPEHVLLSTLLERAHSEGRALDVASLVLQVQSPPLKRVGVFELDQFFPPKSRTKLAMKLNTLLASPSFAAWLDGQPLDVGALLYTPEGKPRAAIVYLHHLSEEERQFVVTLVLSKVVTWMRQQKGTSDLRALVYMDEVFGYCPPTAMPPSKKPILTILKQARAFGVGMVLATQNPADLDYKALSNAGTWLVGRLQTERDKERILEGLRGAGAEDANLAETIGNLEKRQYVLRTGSSAPTLFSTRWAMSYLRGPLTRAEVEELTRATRTAKEADASPAVDAPADSGAAGTPQPEVGQNETPAMPQVADGISVLFPEPSATWLPQLGANPTSRRFSPAVALRIRLTFDERKAELQHTEEYEAVLFPLDGGFDPSRLHVIDHDPTDFSREAPEGAVYRIPGADLDKRSFFKGVQGRAKAHLHTNAVVEIGHAPALKLYSRVGEAPEQFGARCRALADDRADADAAKLRGRFAKRIEKARDQLTAAQRRLAELQVDVDSRKQHELVAGAGQLLSMFIGGRANARGLAGAASRRATVRRTQQRAKSAAEKVAQKTDQLDELEDDLATELEAIEQKWSAAASEVEAFRVGLEKSDIEIAELALVWLPVD